MESRSFSLFMALEAVASALVRLGLACGVVACSTLLKVVWAVIPCSYNKIRRTFQYLNASPRTLRNEVRAEVGPIIPFGPARLRDISTRLICLIAALEGFTTGKVPPRNCSTEEAGSKSSSIYATTLISSLTTSLELKSQVDKPSSMAYALPNPAWTQIIADATVFSGTFHSFPISLPPDFDFHSSQIILLLFYERRGPAVPIVACSTSCPPIALLYRKGSIGED